MGNDDRTDTYAHFNPDGYGHLHANGDTRSHRHVYSEHHPFLYELAHGNADAVHADDATVSGEDAV